MTYEPRAKRMPIHFRHESQPGGPLRGAAFPIILPHHDPVERAARAQIEHEQPHEMISSAINNVVSAVKLELSGNKSASQRSVGLLSRSGGGKGLSDAPGDR